MDASGIIGTRTNWPESSFQIKAPNKPVFDGLGLHDAAAPVGDGRLMMTHDDGSISCGSMEDVRDLGSREEAGMRFKGVEYVASFSPNHKTLVLTFSGGTVVFYDTEELVSKRIEPKKMFHMDALRFDHPPCERPKVVWDPTGQAVVVWLESQALVIFAHGLLHLRLRSAMRVLSFAARLKLPDMLIGIEDESRKVVAYPLDLTASQIVPYVLSAGMNADSIVTRGKLVCIRDAGDQTVHIIPDIYEQLPVVQSPQTMQSRERDHNYFAPFRVSKAWQVYDTIGNACIHPSGTILVVPQKNAVLFIPLDQSSQPDPLLNSPVLTFELEGNRQLSSGELCAFQWSPSGDSLAFLCTPPLKTPKVPLGRTVVALKIERTCGGLELQGVRFHGGLERLELKKSYATSRIMWSSHDTLILCTSDFTQTWSL